MRVAHVRRAHGLRGELLVRALTARPDAIYTPGRRLFAGDAGDAREFVVRSARPTHDGWLIAFDGITDRTSAEHWRGLELWAEREEDAAESSDLPFAADLIGLRLELGDGTVLGTVENYYDLPQGSVLEVARGDELILFPLHPQFVERVDVMRGALVVNPPAGLFT